MCAYIYIYMFNIWRYNCSGNVFIFYSVNVFVLYSKVGIMKPYMCSLCVTNMHRLSIYISIDVTPRIVLQEHACFQTLEGSSTFQSLSTVIFLLCKKKE
jgi:hypothetical protein